MVVRGVKAGSRVLEAKAGAQVAAGHEVVGLAGHAAIFEAVRDRLPAAAVNADAATGKRGAVLGGDLDDTRGLQAVLGRQGTRDYRQSADKAGFENLPETGHAFRQQDSVDTILDVTVLVADVIVARSRGILGNARRLKQNISQFGVAALRFVFDVL